MPRRILIFNQLIIGHFNVYTIAAKLYKEKIVILHSIGIIVIKSRETRAIIHTCRYSSGHFNPYNSANELN